MAQAHHLCLLAEAQALHQEILEDVKIPVSEIADLYVLRLLVGGEPPEFQILPADAFDLVR